jgi:TPR repeat protein
VASITWQALGRGVARSKRRAQQWLRKSADGGYADACLSLARDMYADGPYAREIGLVEDAAGAANPGLLEGHDVPPDVLRSVVHWLRKGGHPLADKLCRYRMEATVGGRHCFNEGCEVVGHAKDFKFCPQCKSARYCGDACQKHDWTIGGHKEKCGTFMQCQKK